MSKYIYIGYAWSADASDMSSDMYHIYMYHRSVSEYRHSKEYIKATLVVDAFITWPAFMHSYS